MRPCRRSSWRLGVKRASARCTPSGLLCALHLIVCYLPSASTSLNTRYRSTCPLQSEYSTSKARMVTTRCHRGLQGLKNARCAGTCVFGILNGGEGPAGEDSRPFHLLSGDHRGVASRRCLQRGCEGSLILCYVGGTIDVTVIQPLPETSPSCTCRC